MARSCSPTSPTTHHSERDEEAVWACPISFSACRSIEEPGRSDWRRFETEISRARALGRTRHQRTAPELGTRTLDEMVASARQGRPMAPIPRPSKTIRLVADDLRTWYLHAASQQPGQRHQSRTATTWFWRETAVAHLHRPGWRPPCSSNDPDPTHPGTFADPRRRTTRPSLGPARPRLPRRRSTT